MARKITIKVPALETTVSGLAEIPDQALCIMALAHGAGAGMEHDFMNTLSQALKNEGVATMRFQFLYMEKGGGRPDRPRIAHEVLRAALLRATRYSEKHNIPVVAGGKSFGGRMFSQLAAGEQFDNLKALVFYGFPLHAPGKEGTDRAQHLGDVKVPMLFLQGSRDSLAKEELIREVSKGLRRATLQVIDGADHGFRMLKRSGISDEEAIADLARRSAAWLRKKLKPNK